ncbi:hypothetical protein [Thiomonas sp. X19]|nr:hypothetical protein [Thiomonas sp. X19]
MHTPFLVLAASLLTKLAAIFFVILVAEIFLIFSPFVWVLGTAAHLLV